MIRPGAAAVFLTAPFAWRAACPSGRSPGRGRIWGSTTLRYWASVDPGRPGREKALILDTGRGMLPFITPDDPDAVAAVISAHSSVLVVDGPAVVA